MDILPDALYPLFTHPLNGLLMVALPIGLGYFLTRRYHLAWRLFWIGAATFILSQVFHIPFNALLNNLFRQGILPMPSSQLPQRIFFAVILGLSAGLFEEIARYIVYRWWARDARTWSKGLLFGAGHGGIEAFLLGVLVLYQFVQMVALRGADLPALVPADQLASLQKAVSEYWSLPVFYSLLGAVERALTIPMHMALSVIVLQVFTRRQIRWLWFAIGWHAFGDALVAGYVYPTWGAYAAEGILGLITLVNFGILFALHQSEPELPGESPLPLHVKTADDLSPVEDSPDSLDESRYNNISS